MKRFKLLLLFGLLASSALSSVTTTEPAFALPTLLFLPGEGVPFRLTYAKSANTVPTSLRTTAGEELSGEGIKLVVNFTSATVNLAPYELLFLNVTTEIEPGEHTDCNTAGDNTGEVILPSGGEVHLVFDSLTPLGVAGMFLVPEFEVKCAAEKIKIKGSVLGLIAPINTEVAVMSNSLLGSFTCAGGNRAAESKYWNAAGELTQAPTLLANFGAGFVQSCVSLNLTLLPKEKMIELMG
jgi:hypothetical protein